MGALQGIRVLDLSRVLAGPWCGQILADLGAEVIKVERPGTGDDTRMWGPPWMLDQNGEQTRESGYFQCTNRNKHSVAIDMATHEGQELIREMAKTADVVIENYKAGSLVRYGLDYDSLKVLNPQLVYCSITGFGQDGPRAAEPGYDFIIQGMAGLMSITGEPDNIPGGGAQKVGVAVVDLQTGLYATIAIQGMNYLSSGKAPQRMGNTHPNIVPYQTFRAKDKEFIVACGNDRQFRELCIAIDRKDLLGRSEFLTNQSRVKHRHELVGILSDYFLQENAQYWVERIHAVKVPVGMINSIEEAFAEPQVQARQMLVKLPHVLNPAFRVIGSPIKLSDTPVEYWQAPPRLGEHTGQILREFKTEEQLQLLRENKVIDGLDL